MIVTPITQIPAPIHACVIISYCQIVKRIGQGFLGIIRLVDEIREETPTVITELKKGGIERTIMLTGDNTATAKAVAMVPALDEFHTELLPQDQGRQFNYSSTDMER